jgi:hypothetical protein
MDAPKKEECDNLIYITIAKDEKAFYFLPNCLRKKIEETSL